MELTNNQHKFNYHKAGQHPLFSLVKTIYMFHQRHFNKMSHVPISEAVLFGLASGPGFLFKNNPKKYEAIGTNSLDYLQDLATSTGTWINRRFSMTESDALYEMQNYLYEWKAPILVTIPQDLFSNITKIRTIEDNFFYERLKLSQPVSKCLVLAINENIVECATYFSDEVYLIDRNVFQLALTNLNNRWIDIIFPSKDISSDWMFEKSIVRHLRQWRIGWKDYGNGLSNLKQFFETFKNNPLKNNWQKTVQHAKNLGGDFGRDWYASYLSLANEKLTCHILDEAIIIYRKLSKLWVELVYNIQNEIVNLDLHDTIISLEHNVISLLINRYEKEEVFHEYCSFKKKL